MHNGQDLFLNKVICKRMKFFLQWAGLSNSSNYDCISRI